MVWNLVPGTSAADKKTQAGACSGLRTPCGCPSAVHLQRRTTTTAATPAPNRMSVAGSGTTAYAGPPSAHPGPSACAVPVNWPSNRRHSGDGNHPDEEEDVQDGTDSRDMDRHCLRRTARHGPPPPYASVPQG